MIAIVIPTKDNTKEFFNCIVSIHKFTHTDYKIFIADTGSTDDVLFQTRDFLESIPDLNYKVIEYDYYNFAKINNDVVRNFIDDSFDAILFCNNDIEIAVDSTIDHMYELFLKNRENIGTVGCRLLYPDKKIQHDGQRFILPNNRSNFLGLTHHGQHEKYDNSRRPDPKIVAGITFALAMTPRDLFMDIGGLNEDYTACFEDVEYNMVCNLRGKANVIVGDEYWAYHYESLSRGRPQGAELERMKHDYKIIRDFVMENMNEQRGFPLNDNW